MKINIKPDVNDIEELVDDIKERLDQLKYLYDVGSSRRMESLEQVLCDITSVCNEALLLYNENSYEALVLKKIIVSAENKE